MRWSEAVYLVRDSRPKAKAVEVVVGPKDRLAGEKSETRAWEFGFGRVRVPTNRGKQKSCWSLLLGQRQQETSSCVGRLTAGKDWHNGQGSDNVVLAA